MRQVSGPSILNRGKELYFLLVFEREVTNLGALETPFPRQSPQEGIVLVQYLAGLDICE